MVRYMELYTEGFLADLESYQDGITSDIDADRKNGVSVRETFEEVKERLEEVKERYEMILKLLADDDDGNYIGTVATAYSRMVDEVTRHVFEG